MREKLKWLGPLAVVIVGLLLISWGVAQRTVWLPPSSVTVKLSLSSLEGAGSAPLIVLDSSILKQKTGAMTITAEGPGTLRLIQGRSDDVDAWVGTTPHVQVTGISDDHQSLQASYQAGNGPTADPAGSDLWQREQTGNGTVSVDWKPIDDGKWSVLLASDGKAAAADSVSVTVPQDNSTPWAVPLIVAGGILILLALLYVLVSRVLRSNKSKSARPSAGRRSAGTPPTGMLPQLAGDDLTKETAGKDTVQETSAEGVVSTTTAAAADEPVKAEVPEKTAEKTGAQLPASESHDASESHHAESAETDTSEESPAGGSAEIKKAEIKKTEVKKTEVKDSDEPDGVAKATNTDQPILPVKATKPKKGPGAGGAGLASVGLILAGLLAAGLLQPTTARADESPSPSGTSSSSPSTSPGSSASPSSTATASGTPNAAAQQGDAAPVLSDSQLNRVLDSVAQTVSNADAAKDAKLLAPRVGAEALLERTANYTIRASAPDYAAREPVAAETRLSQVVSTDRRWPRVTLAITQNSKNLVPQILTLVQANPRENYKLVATARMLPGQTLPNVSAGGSALAANDAAGTASRTPNAAMSAFAGLLSAPDGDAKASFADSTYVSDLAAFQNKLVADAKDANFGFKHEVDPASVKSFVTSDGGLMVVGSLTFTVDATPKADGATLSLTDPGSKALAGGDSTKKGYVLTFHEYVMVHIPPAPGGKIDVVAAERGLTSATFKQ
ncbi:hypothetical protein [Psychromicrobium xiongbiense]|uniref:hypothetical protein n=1 Tax=Psychromicrobium xiongbiense TaxID=3051184 RepID=UPI002554E3B5|nr:hypothetical protein [Psychromicrobium sp. YIM S02556]